MTWLSDAFPASAARALQLLAANTTTSGSNSTSASADAPTPTLGAAQLNLDAAWQSAGAAFPLVSLWTLALLLALVALNLLGVLLSLTWRLARGSLALWHTRKLVLASAESATASHSSGRAGTKTTRKLRLPGAGAVLALLAVASVAQIIQVVRIGTWGRLAWLDGTGGIARAVCFTSLWLAGLFATLTRISTLPLFSRAAGTSKPHLAPPRALSMPALYPLLVDFLALALPLLVCLGPAYILFAQMQSARSTLDAFVGQALASQSQSQLQSPAQNSDTVPVDAAAALAGTVRMYSAAVLGSWRAQGYARALALLALLLISVLIERRSRTRLAKIAEYLAEADEAPERATAEAEKPPVAAAGLGMPAGLSRTYSISSYSSGRRSLASKGSARQHTPISAGPLREIDLPSPGLLRHDAEYATALPELEYGYPSSLDAQRDPRFSCGLKDGSEGAFDADESDRSHLLRYGPLSRASSFYAHQHTHCAFSDDDGASSHGIAAPLPYRSLSRQTLVLPPMIRTRTYASSAPSSSYRSSSSYTSCRSHASSRSCRARPYVGPSIQDIMRQRRAGSIDACALIGVVGLSCLFEALDALLKRVIVEERRLEAAFEIAILVLQIVPVLAGLLFTACRMGGDGPAYGWEEAAPVSGNWTGGRCAYLAEQRCDDNGCRSHERWQEGSELRGDEKGSWDRY